MFYILYSWIHSLHSWRINMDILRPHGFLCCASKDRKWSSWLLIGWRGGERSDGVIWEADTQTHKTKQRRLPLLRVWLLSRCIFKLILSICFLLAAVKLCVNVCVVSHVSPTRKETEGSRNGAKPPFYCLLNYWHWSNGFISHTNFGCCFLSHKEIKLSK